MDYKNQIDSATNKVKELTPSVVVIARLMKVNPADLAVALYDDEANATFQVDMVASAIKAAIKKSQEAAKANK